MPKFTMFHDPPAAGYLKFLAEELQTQGLPAKVMGRGFAASLVFDDPEMLERYGRIYFHQPGSGCAEFIWKSGGTIGPVSDAKAAAELVRKVVTAE